MLKILVTGGQGQLGQCIRQVSVDYPEHQWTFIDVDELDLTELDTVDLFFQNASFDVLIHCAAYTAVDKAESEEDLAYLINHLAVEYLSEIAKKYSMKMILVSTDYVFNGQSHRPYVENDVVAPCSVYGLTKLAGEQAMQRIAPQGCIVRTSWVYSEFGQNFVKTMLRLGAERDSLNVIFDQVGTPTYAVDLAQALVTIAIGGKWDLISKGKEIPIYHYSNEGVCSWFDFANAIFELSNISCDVSAIETVQYPTPAKRPFYSVLNKAKIKQELGVNVPYWRDSLKICLEKLNS